MLSAAAIMTGGINIWFDAAGALCAAFVIVDTSKQIGVGIYHGYLRARDVGNLLLPASAPTARPAKPRVLEVLTPKPGGG
jgi:hypothetical protein